MRISPILRSYLRNNMKNLILLALLLPQVLFSQTKLGRINDPDGYTNIRKEPSGKSEILDRMNTGEIFEFSISESNWYKIWTNYGISGYMHNSKIQEVKFECDCNGYGGANSSPILRYSSSGKVLSVCGTIDSVENRVIYGTEFLVQDCLNSELLNEPSISPQKIELINGKITVAELASLPISNDWQYDLTPVVKNSYFFVGGRFIAQTNNGVYAFPKFSEHQLLLEFNKLRTELGGNHIYQTIKRALVLSLNNCKECEVFFLRLEDHLGLKMDGEYAETYYEALRIFELNKKESNN